MEGKNLKRGAREESNTEDETSVKQPRLSEVEKGKSDEDGDAADEEFEDLTEQFDKKSEAGEQMCNLEPQLPDGDAYVLVEAPVSDDWIYVLWQDGASDIWVVMKSSYSWTWIHKLLDSPFFFGFRTDGKDKKFEICSNKKMELRSGSCVIFCFQNNQWDPKSLKEVKQLSSEHAMKNVIILLSEETPDGQVSRQIMDPCEFPLLNFSKPQLTFYENHLQFYSEKMDDLRQSLRGGSRFSKKQKIGIFSRSAESDFEWLKMQLKSEYFRDVVEDVRPYYISNSGFQQFITNVSNCTFGILYHTKNRGRINITDVTDSLYDEELTYMSGILEKKVIVVVDDLQKGNDEEKSRILDNQPSIKEKALNLLLFTTEEKKFLKPLERMRNLIHGENKGTM